MRSLESDLARLKKLMFGRFDACGDLLSQFHAHKKKIAARDDAEIVWNVYDWLLVPFTLWPLDFAGMAKYLMPFVEGRKKFDEQFLLLLKLVGSPPKPATCVSMENYEREIASGNYEGLVKRKEKFDELEKRLKDDVKLQQAWTAITARFDVTKHQNKRGVIRRRMSQERNFRSGFGFKWDDHENQFHALFDALCYRWDLYGMEKDRPLLLKITVNPTPHGTMIFIPRYWSVDSTRDLKWKEICRLHRIHGATRQGPKLSLARMERDADALAAGRYDQEARKAGLKGEKRYAYILRKLKQEFRDDWSFVKRLLKRAKELQTAHF